MGLIATAWLRMRTSEPVGSHIGAGLISKRDLASVSQAAVLVVVDMLACSCRNWVVLRIVCVMPRRIMNGYVMVFESVACAIGSDDGGLEW